MLDGIVKYMKSKAGPASKELSSVEDATKFINNQEHSIIGQLFLKENLLFTSRYFFINARNNDGRTIQINLRLFLSGFFDTEASEDNGAFQQTATKLSESFRFAHTFSPDVVKHLQAGSSKVVIFQPSRLHTKMLPAQQAFEGDLSQLNVWIENNL